MTIENAQPKLSPPVISRPKLTMKLPLDPLQRAAAEMPPGPLIVIGGPGSGKTHTLIGRIAALIAANAYPSTITYLTFSSKAAEMARKEISGIAEGPEIMKQLFVGTFHSHASSFLRQAGAARIGRSPHYSLWDHDEAREAIASFVNDREDSRPGTPDIPKMTGKEINEFLHWHGLNRARWVEEPIPADAAHWYEVIELYNQEKIRQNVMDLDDLIPMAVRALESDPQLRTVWTRIRTKHIMVDEFQDLTPIQYRLLQLMIGDTKSITIATDPNQSIFSWRGADPRMLDQFRLDHPEAEIQMLRINHRSTATLANIATALAEHKEMTGLVNAYQQPIRREGPRPELIDFNGNQEELSKHIVDQAEQMVRSGVCQWEDMAMVYRRKNSKNRLITTLTTKVTIPYHIMGDVKKPGQNTIQRVINLMTSVLNPLDVNAFMSAATVEPGENGRGLNAQVARNINRIAQEQDLDLIEATTLYLPTLRAKNKTRTNLEYLLRAWNALKTELEKDQQTLTEYFQTAIKIVQRQQVERLDEGINGPATQLLAIAHTSNRLSRESLMEHLTRFLETLKSGAYPDLQDSGNENPLEEQKGLTLATIHAAKGLQWPVVWIVDARDEIMPGNVDRSHTRAIEEEQRIFFVASTRAADRLFYCSANGGSKGSESKPSRFIAPLHELVLHRMEPPPEPNEDPDEDPDEEEFQTVC